MVVVVWTAVAAVCGIVVVLVGVDVDGDDGDGW